MAPIGEVYFPPLDRCLSGEQQLLSWKETYVALSQIDGEAVNGSLRRHLTDPLTVHLLTSSFSPYPAPISNTKSSFETKTSAIHVTPSAHPRYDIQQIKDDTVWLSKETKIDEVSALRIVVLEWQVRPATQLLRGSLGDEISLQQTGISGSQLGASLSGAGSSLLPTSLWLGRNTSAPFDDTGARRRRLLETYLSERRFILKTSEFIASIASGKCDGGPAKKPEQRAPSGWHWLAEIGGSILSAWNTDGPLKGKGKKPIVDAVDALRARLQGLMSGSGWTTVESLQEDIELIWTRNQILEMIHIMQIILILLESCSNRLTDAESILSWFRLMNDYSFFESIPVLHPALQGTYDLPFQSLVALISLAILKISSTLDTLEQSSTAGVSTNVEHNSPYVLNSGAINELNDIITTFVSLKVSSAAVLAWSVILQRLKDITAVTRESREIRQSLRAVDRYGTAEPSDTDGAERTSKRSAMSPQRRSSTGSDTSQQSTLIEELHDTVLVAAATVDPVTSLATSALDEGKFFDTIIDIVTEYCSPFGFEYGGKPSQRMRKILIDLIRTCVGFFEYHPALFLATLELLTGSERYWDTVDRPAEFGKFGPDAEFFHDDELKHKFWTSALYRFPYETLPFLQLCKALTFHIDGSDLNESAIWSKLEEVDTFTCRLPIHFEAYKPVHMQEEDDYIQLTASLSLAIGTEVGRSADQPFADSKMYSALRMFKEPSGLYTIPSSTEGKIISTSKPFVVTWNHPYSILAYIGQVLQCASAVEDSSTTDSNNTIPMETVGEIIGLISAMLSSAARRETTEYNTSSRLECAESILRSTSDGLDRNRDIISTVLEIFEKELYRHRKISEDLGSMDVLVQCIQFAHALIPFKPDRIWPFLGRSGLLGIDKKESQLSAVVATQEMLLGRYDFLLGCIRLFDALVEDAVTHAVSRNAPTKTITRFGDAVSLGTGVSRIAIEKVLESFTRTMIEVFECTMNWRFVEKGERLEINYRLSMIFQKILDYCFAVNDNPNISQKLTSALAPAAEYIVSVFLSGSNNDVTVLPLLHTFGEGIETPITTLPTRGLRYWTLQVRSALKLTSTLIRVNNLVRQPPSHLEAQMFKAAPILAKVYAAHESYKLPVVDLFDSLVRSAAANNQQSPSLLGHLGQETASNFLEVLSVLDQPLNDDDLSSSIWRLLSAVISKRQQWFAIFVLTGSTPRDSFRNKTESASLVSQHPDPILNRALDSLSQITKLEPKKALSMLEFVALAADFWPWVLSAMASHGRFLMAISKFGAHVGSRTATTPGKPHKTSADFFNLKMASYVADILAMYTNYRLQLNDLNFAKALVPHLAYLIKNAILAPSYNNSLHTNLRKNFEAKFSGLSLLDFKRTALNRSQLGGSFFYDLELANKLLAYNPAWEGKKGRGFAEEVQRANLDLSVVDSQVDLFHSWKMLLLELSGPLAKEPKFQKIMAVAVIDCLKANAENILPEVLFERLAQSRAELAFALSQRLLEVKSAEPEIKGILPVAWNTLRMHDSNMGSAFNREDADYYRILLRILYLALQLQTIDIDPKPSEDLKTSRADNTLARPHSPNSAFTIQTVLDIIGTIVAKGFRALTIVLHDTPTLVYPSDFSLITSILRSALRIPGVTRNTSHLMAAFSESQTARCASTLLSWADQLATNGDPIYGELSVSFLLEMSTVASLAESLAVEGVLSHILATNLIRVLQTKAFGPLDQPVRMHSIWVRGILPLLVNLLDAVGPPLAAEIAAALNQFPHQLARASNSFAVNSRVAVKTGGHNYITLSTASEAVTLSLIVSILQTFREAGASAAIVASEVDEVGWGSVQVKEDVEGWLQSRGALAERIVATNQREEAWSKQKPVQKDGGCDNRLEERVVEEMNMVVATLRGDNGE